MAVTAQQVYDAAMVLIDEVTEVGSISPENPEYYKTRAKSILTSLQAELLPVTTTPIPIVNLTQTMLVSDRTALLVMPYGLAAHLLLQEDVNTAAFFNNRYDELKKKIPAAITTIQDVYNVAGVMQ